MTTDARSPAAPARDVVREWIADLDQRVRDDEISRDTRQTYERGFREFETWARDRIGQAVTQRAVKDWMEYLKRERPKKNERGQVVGVGVSPATRAVWLAGVRSFFQWLVSEGVIPGDPTTGVKAGKRATVNKEHKRGQLTDEEVARLFKLELVKRDRALLALFLYTGARGIEAHRADVQDLKTEGNDLVLYVQRKGAADTDDFDKVIIAHPDARGAIYDYLAERGASSGPLFVTERDYDGRPRRMSRQTLRRIVRAALDAAGVTTHDKSTHSLRHTAASKALSAGADVRSVQKMLGHTRQETTEIYLHEEDRRTKAAERFIKYNV
ncbi:MAG TPA: tyrosine-type recombinase/integrase [Blastocatellia bacterium]|nr:tyrosine-type recombinase/integrase [Blastocatellia bacterium]